MKNIGDVLSIRTELPEPDGKIFFPWEVWFLDTATNRSIKQGTLITHGLNVPTERRHDGVVYRLRFFNTMRRQVFYER